MATNVGLVVIVESGQVILNIMKTVIRQHISILGTLEKSLKKQLVHQQE